MSLNLMGKKRGMLQLFDEKGKRIVCTVIEVEPNVITQIKTKESDGYLAVQSGAQKITAKDPRRQEKRVKKPMRGHFKKSEAHPRRHLFETKTEAVQDYELGQEYGVEIFKEGQKLDISAFSIGKGYQGLMKKENYSGGPGAHGSKFHRHAGSTGMRSTPGRCLPGGPRPSQMGNKKVTVQGLEIHSIEEEKGLVLVKGSVPGSRGSLLMMKEAVKSKESHKK